MTTRIYADESGTQSEKWLIIGMLFVPTHGVLHSELCRIKDDLSYFNTSPKHSAKYKESHFTKFKTHRDVSVASRWITAFLNSDAYYRSVVIDWSLWDSRYFGDPFEPESLKKRRAYKKWAEMLLQPELTFVHGKFYLDRLRIMYGYDVLDHLKSRFTQNYVGESPYIDEFQHTDSKKDANQCLQLCDVLTGCLYQSLSPAKKHEKIATRDYLAQELKNHNVKSFRPEFWKQYDKSTLNQHFPKYSAWFWKPTAEGKKRNKNRRKRR